jgi:hypothetical protein
LAQFGPFAVRAEQIVSLGPESFTEFINKLLDVENAAVGWVGQTLRTTYRYNVNDGGVDAALIASQGTKWLPAGDSVWQFKSGDFSAGDCASELKKATRAIELLRGGASYRLVLGFGLTETMMSERLAALEGAARELDLDVSEGLFAVYGADSLASWASDHPALAVLPLLQGLGHLALDHATWASGGLQYPWVASETRDERIALIRNAIQTERTHFHIEGDQGVGKTRLLMEATLGRDFTPLVAYIQDAGGPAHAYIRQLLVQNRPAVVILDECGRRQHEKFRDTIPANGNLLLISIGEREVYPIDSPTILVANTDEADIATILEGSHSSLPVEARRFLAANSEGNIRQALVFATHLSRGGNATALEIAAANDFKSLLADIVSGRDDFLGAAVLALFERLGWEGEVASELDFVAGEFGIERSLLEQVAGDLQEQGFLRVQGRYRSVGPHPLALYLASQAWHRIGVERLLQAVSRMPPQLAQRFFSRAAALGDFEPTRTAIESLLLHPGGMFGELATVADEVQGELLTQMAIVAPEAVSAHLHRLLQSATQDELRAAPGRRALVRALEKLVWHRRTFLASADDLLRLAAAEIETWSNNATGTWLALFATQLPATAATPQERTDYLRAKAVEAEPFTRSMVAKAAAGTFTMHETVMVSGELQSGFLVEGRGTPKNRQEAVDYLLSMMSLLGDAEKDSDASVSDTARNGITSSIHFSLEIPELRDALADVVVGASERCLAEALVEISKLEGLFSRLSSSDVDGRRTALRAFTERMPTSSLLMQLATSIRLPRWDFKGDELQVRILDEVRRVFESEIASSATITDYLREAQLPAAYELGYALGQLSPSPDIEQSLTSFKAENFPALTGYLWGQLKSGNENAFDAFLEGPLGQQLSTFEQVSLDVRGAKTERSTDRVLRKAGALSPRLGAAALSGWQKQLTDEEIRDLVTGWLGRLESQEDYNSVVDFMNMVVHGVDEVDERTDALIRRVVMLRSEYPNLAGEKWDWDQLARRTLPDNATEIAGLLLNELETSPSFIHAGDEDGAILGLCAQFEPAAVFRVLIDSLSEDHWRTQMSIRGWLLSAFPDETITDWVGSDLGRGQLVAAITPVDGDQPSVVVRTLLERFPEDDSVESSLWSGFVSGSWMGNDSQRLAGQISQLQGWLKPEEPTGVRKWASKMLEYLGRERTSALQREAEQGY